ncbi:MAG: hypothetical protein ACT4PI_01215 [Actinomycetota bacterium]
MKLSQLRSSLSRYASSFDPALVSARDAARIRDEASAIRTIAAAIEARAAARVAETSVW